MNFEDLEDVRELSAAQVEEWLCRRHGWASAHVSELGGYFEGRFRFPVHGIRRWQESRALEFLQRRAS